jgi:hypothetical protein
MSPLNLSTLLVLALVLNLAFAGAPSVCGNTGVVASLGLDEPIKAVCQQFYTCSIQCKCPEFTRFLDIQTTSTWPTDRMMRTTWNSNCKHTKCTCAHFFELLGKSPELISEKTDNICACGKKPATFVSPIRTPHFRVKKTLNAESLEHKALELEQKALELEQKAESLELE